jgi:hypothetical protein
MAIERIPRIRLRGVHDDSLFVVRGDELDASVLAEDASRFHERFIEWGRFGISAFQATNESEIDVICQTRLVRRAARRAGDAAAAMRTPRCPQSVQCRGRRDVIDDEHGSRPPG